MKKSQVLMLAVVLGFGAAWMYAQDSQGPRPRSFDEEMGDEPCPERHFHHHPPPPPVMVVLDKNHDGKLDAEEIANAAAALATLDKNGDGELTFEELRPPFPPEGFGPPPDDRDDGPESGPRDHRAPHRR